MLDKKIIKKSSSPYASPIVLVRKKFGGIRLCIDYRKINEITLKDSFPLPRIEETLEVLGGAKFFSSLDLAHGYFQVAMKEEDIPKTAFRVPWGSTSSIGCRKGSAIAPVHFRGLWN
ncbi:putative transposon Ty3-I Gag-Pol polyprotein [Apostichopus japonicus]|nr:putative transposon Ty3-I Gag-Pol polyprotein [Apostichopus japonicus]